MRCSRIFTVGALLLVTTAVTAPAQELTRANFSQMQSLIKPRPGEANWRNVDWMPSTNIWAARQKAAKERKPLLLWYMAGEPLGRC